MKDHIMSKLDQADFQKAKDTLDKCIARIDRLVQGAEEAMTACCRSDDPSALDTRDQFAELAGCLREANGKLMHARAAGGRIAGNGLARGGGT